MNSGSGHRHRDHGTRVRFNLPERTQLSPHRTNRNPVRPAKLDGVAIPQTNPAHAAPMEQKPVRSPIRGPDSSFPKRTQLSPRRTKPRPPTDGPKWLSEKDLGSRAGR